MLRQYACHTFDLPRAEALGRRRFEPSDCSLAPFDTRRFLDHTRNRR
jgi:hypothetical protein